MLYEGRSGGCVKMSNGVSTRCNNDMYAVSNMYNANESRRKKKAKRNERAREQDRKRKEEEEGVSGGMWRRRC